MFDLSAFAIAAGSTFAFAALGWLLSLRLRNVSIVDSLWSLMFLLTAASYALLVDQAGPRSTLVLALLAIWAVRLSAYITWRNWGSGEDFRYQEIRANNQPGFAFKSLFMVFGLQGLLAVVIVLPVLVAIRSDAALGLLDLAGVLLWIIGLIFEAGGDWQLARFRANPDNQGKVLNSGLWALTRHPNYFGDCCVWWGFFLFGVSAGGWWTLLSPLLMTGLLLKVSGVALLEKNISDRRPEYARYIRETNAFLPGPRRRGLNAAMEQGEPA